MKSILYMTAEWCGPCRVMKPLIQKLISQGLPIQIVDVDQEPAIQKKYNVRAIPTFIIFENGNEISRKVGAQTEQSLLSMVK